MNEVPPAPQMGSGNVGHQSLNFVARFQKENTGFRIRSGIGVDLFQRGGVAGLFVWQRLQERGIGSKNGACNLTHQFGDHGPVSAPKLTYLHRKPTTST